MPTPPSGINATSMNDSTCSAGTLDCPVVFEVVATMFVRSSSNNAPQLLQTEAVDAFLFLQTGQYFSETFKFIFPKNKLKLLIGILHPIARNLNKETRQSHFNIKF